MTVLFSKESDSSFISRCGERRKKERLHSSHIGVNGCLRRARECMYWPGMTVELKEYTSQCETCSKYEVRQQKESLMSHEISDRPWEKAGTPLMVKIT